MSFSTTRNWGNSRLVHKQIYPLDLNEALSGGTLDEKELWVPPIGQRIKLLAATLRIRVATPLTSTVDSVIANFPKFRLKTSNGNLTNIISLSTTNGDAANDVHDFAVGPLAGAANYATSVGAALADITGGQDPTEAEHILATTRINELRVDVLAIVAALNAGGGTVQSIITVDAPLLLDVTTALTYEAAKSAADLIWKAQLDLIGVLL